MVLYLYIAIPFTLAIGFAIYSTLMHYFFSPLSHIPGPDKFHIMKDVSFYIKHVQDSIGILEKWGRDFHYAGIYKLEGLMVPDRSAVILLKSEYVKTVLKNQTIFRKSEFLKNSLPLLGNGIATAEGDDHKNQKKFLHKAFSPGQMKYYVPVFNKHAKILTEILSDSVKGEKNGKNISVKEYCSRMALDAVAEISFGYSFDSQRTKLNPFIKSLIKLAEGVMAFKSRLILRIFPFMWYMPFGPAKALQEANDLANQVLDDVITTRLRLIKENKLTETQENDLLANMMSDEDGLFTTKLIKDSAFTFLFAGYETTATTLLLLMYHLAKYPDLQEKVREEVMSKISDFEDLDTEELENISYTDAFIKETMRSFTTSPIVDRTAAEDSKLGPYNIPKGTRVLSFISHIHKYEYEDGYTFNPNRWLDGDADNTKYLPFSAGPRACIGKYFGMAELRVAMIQIMRKLRFSIDSVNDSYNRGIAITIRFHPPLLIRVHQL